MSSKPLETVGGTTSPFPTSATIYRERDLAIMPCGPGTKFPGRFSASEWHTAHDWQKYCERLPSDFETDIWGRWPDAGICLALGKSSAPAGLQLVAVDIDTEDAAEVGAIRAVLPGSPVRKRGAKGETEFYLAPTSVPNRPYNATGKRRMLDLLCHGRQTVLPPTIHPDTGAAYVWTTLDTLENFDVADLPVLPDDIADRLSAALAPFGHVDAPTIAERDPDAEASTHRQLNDAALANLGAWVPALNLYKCRQVGGKYKAVSSWRPSSSGRPLSARATNLAIAPDGIKDCGEGKGYTPIDLVMAACGASLDAAFRWLQERVAPAAPIMLTARVVVDDEPDVFVRTSPRGNLGFLHLATVDGEAVPTEVVSHQPPANSLVSNEDAFGVTQGLIPAELCTPAGLLGDIVLWMNAASPVPSPQLNLATALAFLGTIYGRRYEAPTGARTNLYCIGIAPSGFGKSFPLKCVNAIEGAANLERFFGPSGLKSDSALRKLLEVKNPVLVTVDEVGELFRKILNRKAASHEVGLRELLLNLFSSAEDVYRGSEGATERAVPIYNPHLSVLGMSTPSAWWSAFNMAQSENGLLPRILIFDAGIDEPDEVTPAVSRRDVPREIVQQLHASLDVQPTGNIAAIGGRPLTPLTARWGVGAADVYDCLKAEIKSKRRATTGLEEVTYSRFAEHTIKLALLLAISRNAADPEITEDCLSWARSIVEHTTRALLHGAVDRVADNEYQADYKRVFRIIKDAGPFGISVVGFNRVIAGSLDRRRISDTVEQLKNAREIVECMGTGPKGGRPGARYRAMCYLAEEVA